MTRTPKWQRELGLFLAVEKLAKRKKRKKRRMAAMTQQEAAQALGVSHTAIQRYRRMGLVQPFSLPGVKMRSVLLDADSVREIAGNRPKRGRPRKAR